MSIDAFPGEKAPVDVVAASLEDGLPENKSEETKINAAETPPRKDAWLILIGGWLLLFTTFGYMNAFGVYKDVLTRAGTSSPSNISWMGST
ncbi:hypothetical protein DAEQUDRAFT_765876 [Daedalea quercina L-15889]|uniref:Major facilitator superfamily (MFS) profile domain-containing protein n=1 Tax=Daedalea quercina L-15889 TaxID=1314783 RepID=A0A165Q0U7_9APHY|nr:hypothetical protein DAEQUDRAFT_765876 [Daedalea quercina L-15889]